MSERGPDVRDGIAIERLNPRERFSDRVDDYVRFRPGYPPALLETLRSDAGLSADSVVADVGSGTGISARMLLETGCTVFAIEPNAGMRKAAEERLGSAPGFHSIAATAEATGLADRSVDLVTAGQAFHWFDTEGTRKEFTRILVDGGSVALFWNRRLSVATPFLEGYDRLLRDHGTDYANVGLGTVAPSRLEAFYEAGFRSYTFPNEQTLDFESLLGRVRSSSYTPGPGHRDYGAMVTALRELFDAHQRNGAVRFLYETELYIGRPSSR